MTIHAAINMRQATVQWHTLQVAIWAWQTANFPHGKAPRHAFEGMCEEVGELQHAVLKMVQGIRGTSEQHRADAKDAIGDIGVYLFDFYRRAEMGCVAMLPGYFTWDSETAKHMASVQLEATTWRVFKHIARFGLTFEPCFAFEGPLPLGTHPNLRDAASLLCGELIYLCNLLSTTVYKCIHNVYTDVLLQRDWQAHPHDGVTA